MGFCWISCLLDFNGLNTLFMEFVHRLASGVIQLVFFAVVFTGSSQELCPGVCCYSCGAMGLLLAYSIYVCEAEP